MIERSVVNAMIAKLDHEPLAIGDMADYKAQMHAELEELKVRVVSTALYKDIMDTNWFESASRIIDEMGPDFRFHDQKYHLFEFAVISRNWCSIFMLLFTSSNRLQKIRNDSDIFEKRNRS